MVEEDENEICESLWGADEEQEWKEKEEREQAYDDDSMIIRKKMVIMHYKYECKIKMKSREKVYIIITYINWK